MVWLVLYLTIGLLLVWGDERPNKIQMIIFWLPLIITYLICDTSDSFDDWREKRRKKGRN